MGENQFEEQNLDLLIFKVHLEKCVQLEDKPIWKATTFLLYQARPCMS